MKSLLNNKKGFSIAEIVTVSAIFVIILSLTLASFRRGEHRSEFILIVEEVASSIRKMQIQSLTGIIGEEDEVASGGYGVYFDLTQAGQYTLFRTSNDEAYDGADEVVSIVDLPPEVNLSELPDAGGNDLSVVFKPPKPTIYINGQTASQLSEATIDIFLVSDRISDKRGQITVNAITGRITSEFVNNP